MSDVVIRVFSAYAEVFLVKSVDVKLEPSFLRVRGGVSKSQFAYTNADGFSPRTRRCFRKSPSREDRGVVFSAYAEVFLLIITPKKTERSFLRVRGGVSFVRLSTFPRTKFSPRTRRCFLVKSLALSFAPVFSAYAEVFLSQAFATFRWSRFLRVRGGVSYKTF